jgi:hypothetical protein
MYAMSIDIHLASLVTVTLHMSLYMVVESFFPRLQLKLQYRSRHDVPRLVLNINGIIGVIPWSLRIGKYD